MEAPPQTPRTKLASRVELVPLPRVEPKVAAKPTPKPDPEAVLPRAPAPQAQPTPVAQRMAPETEVAPHEPTAEPAPEFDMTGITLTSQSGSFAVAKATGTRRRGPIAPRRTKTVRPDRSARVTRPATAAPKLVPLADLSRKPRAPHLNGALRANYPSAARAQGLAGSARVRVRIGPDGVARGARVISESAAGFGDACRRTVEGSRWGAPLDARGRAVSTTIVYRCRFRVQA